MEYLYITIKEKNTPSVKKYVNAYLVIYLSLYDLKINQELLFCNVNVLKLFKCVSFDNLRLVFANHFRFIH